MDENEFMEWLATILYGKEDGPFCPFPLGGYCDCPVSKECIHCVFCPKSDGPDVKDLIFQDFLELALQYGISVESAATPGEAGIFINGEPIDVEKLFKEEIE